MMSKLFVTARYLAVPMGIETQTSYDSKYSSSVPGETGVQLHQHPYLTLDRLREILCLGHSEMGSRNGDQSKETEETERADRTDQEGSEEALEQADWLS
jgi:hypothetical protein